MAYIARAVLALLVALCSTTAALAAGPNYRIEVAGLACPFCAYGIEKSLLALDGVERVQTNIAEGAVTVTMKDDARLDEVTARRAVEDAGFTLRGFEQVSSGNSQ